MNAHNPVQGLICYLAPTSAGHNRTGECTAYTPLLAYVPYHTRPRPEEPENRDLKKEKKEYIVEKKENLAYLSADRKTHLSASLFLGYDTRTSGLGANAVLGARAYLLICVQISQLFGVVNGIC